MSILNKTIKNYPLGIWIAFIALVLIFIAWFMQGYSLINWEGAVKLGFQNEGCLAEYERWGSKGFVDLYVFALLRKAWNRSET